MIYIKRLKILIACFLVLFISFLAVFPVGASESSVSGSDNLNSTRFTPFNLSLRGKIANASYDESLVYNVPLPDMYFDLEGMQSTFSDYAFYYSLGPGNIDYQINSEFLDSNSNFISYSLSGNYNSPSDFSLYDDATFLFQNCYLGSDSKIDKGKNDGVSFAVVGPTDSLYDATVYGDFYLPGFRDSFSFEYDYGSFLSYYAALVNSDIPWSDFSEYYSNDYTVAEFLANIEIAKSYEFLYLTDDQISLLSDMFDWVGYIYGLFGCDCSDFYGDDGIIACSVFSALVRSQDLLSYYRLNVDQATYSGLTGFERVTRFLGTAVSGFLNLEIMPGFSFSGFLIVFISFALVVWWLKVFAGG